MSLLSCSRVCLYRSRRVAQSLPNCYKDPPTLYRTPVRDRHQGLAVGNKGSLNKVALNGHGRGGAFADVTYSVSDLDII
jgi:hypothetical protein